MFDISDSGLYMHAHACPCLYLDTHNKDSEEMRLSKADCSAGSSTEAGASCLSSIHIGEVCDCVLSDPHNQTPRREQVGQLFC